MRMCGETNVENRHTRLKMDLSVRLPKQEQSQRAAPIQVVLAYDGHVAFQAARKIYRAVVRRLDGRFEFRECWLPFSAFAEPQSLERAVNVAAEAEMVFCCPSNPYLLPGLVQDWIRLWLKRRSQPDGALVLLLPTMAENVSRQTLMERDLRATARAADLAFFVSEYIDGRDLPSVVTKTSVAGQENFDAARILQNGLEVRHWGINE